MPSFNLLQVALRVTCSKECKVDFVNYKALCTYKVGCGCEERYSAAMSFGFRLQSGLDGSSAR